MEDAEVTFVTLVRALTVARFGFWSVLKIVGLRFRYVPKIAGVF